MSSSAVAGPSTAESRFFTVLYFAAASSFTGKDRETLAAPLPLSKLFSELESRHPGIRARILDSCLVTINLTYVDVPPPPSEGDDATGNDQVMIQAADEVAIIPPVSSG